MPHQHHHHHHKHWRRRHNWGGGYDPGYDQDQDQDNDDQGNMEFNYESNYEMAPGFEIGNEEEYYPSNEAEDEGGYSGEDRESEDELEYVTNEQEFEHWVHGATRYHPGIRGILGHPLGRMAIRHFSRMAPVLVPGLGGRRGGWRGRVFPGHYGAFYNRGWNRPGYWGRPEHWRHPHPYWGAPDGASYPDTDSGGTPAPTPGPSSGADISAPPPATGDSAGGDFKNFVLGTLKNLSQQVMAGNDNINALKSSMANSAATNMPSIVQPAGDGSGGTPPQQGDAGQGGSQQAGGAQQTGGAPQSGGTPPAQSGGNEMEGEVYNSESSFNETTEMELASELLSVQNEEELDHFLGDLLGKAVGAVSGILGGGGRGGGLKNALGGIVKGILPLAGTVAGTAFGGPLGASIGGSLGKLASGLFEMELEGLSNEDQEFETARAFVRFAGNAARQLADSQSNDPQEDVRRAVIEAASRFAPGLLVDGGHRHHRHHHHHHHHGHGYDQYGNERGGNERAGNERAGNGYERGGYGATGGGEHGRWFRRGNKIILEQD
ncbi:MAG TPA: hypothetical protein VNU70_05510 [Puia sp.]|nr:hypothetical protein [Puia sp.]